MSESLMVRTSPQDSLAALESAVAKRFDWRMMRGGTDEQPRFLIEKKVRYELIRGFSMYALYQISGGFQQAADGQTRLQYTVSGQSGVPVFQAAVVIIGMLAITALVGMVVFDPIMPNRWVGLLLLGVLVAGTILYGVLAYRSYRGHLREMEQFMWTFAEG